MTKQRFTLKLSHGSSVTVLIMHVYNLQALFTVGFQLSNRGPRYYYY